MMRSDTIYLIPRGTFGDKNDNLQYDGPQRIAGEILRLWRLTGQEGHPRKFVPLYLFEQGNSFRPDGTQWIMIESWSPDSDLMFEFCEYVAEELNLNLELGFPK